MTAFLIHWLVMSVIIWLTALLLPGIKISSFPAAFIVSALFGLLHWAIGWLLFVGLGIATLGLGFVLAFLARLVVTAIVLQITAAITPKLEVKGFGSALLAALVMSGLATVAERLI